MRCLFLLVAGGTALVAVPVAGAHVTVNPQQAAPGSFARLAIQVPNEEEGADTVKVSVRLPAGLGEVSFEPKAGWKRSVAGQTVTWSGGRIGPGEFDEFVISAELPDTPGRTLVFPAVQTYSNGKVVRWIGPPSADEPAPRVQLETVALGKSTAVIEKTENSRANLALGFGIAGLVAGLAALGVTLLRRRA